MTPQTRHLYALMALASIVGCVAFCSSALASVAPLPRSDYGVQAVCGHPTPGHAGCLALALVPRTPEAAARTHPLGVAQTAPQKAPSPAAGDFGLRPADLHSAYELPTSAATAQRIALVDAYNDPTAESDLAGYDEEFALPECTTKNGCFKQVNEKGESEKPPFPATTAELEAARKGTPEQIALAKEATGWGLEISLDIESAHATCQSCQIVLVEAGSTNHEHMAESTNYEHLEAAEERAVLLGADEISNSWGSPELNETAKDELESQFNHPGIVITASAGDDGYLSWDAENSFESGYAEFPASSPHVVAVGGTRLVLHGASLWSGESVWNGDGAGGGGCSIEFTAAPWQQNVAGWANVGCANKRAVADVSADADPYTGLAVHDSSPACEFEEKRTKHVTHWCTIGGTSLASPVIASVFALAGGSHGVEYPSRTLYENAAHTSGSLHDVTSGSNGECSQPFVEETGLSGCSSAEEAAASCPEKLICLAASGYDGPSGLGTPKGIAAFEPLSGAGNERAREEETEEEESEQESGHSAGGPSEPVKPEEAPPTSTGPAAPGSGASTAAAGVHVSALALTVKALIALNRARPNISQIVLAFTINAATQVRVTLARQVRIHHRTRWQALRRSPPMAVVSGVNSRHLGGHGRLARGVYRLTLTPTHGASRSITFRIG
jgi:hypothetical protein